ncbi:hypothetical protein PTSG_01872 [Salpingoeca rosetta]|uniref:Uncharacterized protein n=1 Tax=Salpingoeca rosetta (strain ATCC 50818 / BSB-021) TaxID=946362 RepID=F2TZ72_SALR5|nr:uncharacterized protein PTSG_01872 [Salpingoeca rosetta]EGD78896.1 hypothetical protein PTSG_01872 [Salpingoeca rosetta]|eukprot:XP_004997852.1 hypothetical protein PTSG_01872 [Salpingoeca rosetta]
MTGWSSGKVQRLSSSPTNELLQLSPIDKAAFNKPLVAFTPHHVSTDQEELKRPKLPFRLTGVLYLLLTIEFFQGLGVLFTMGVGEGSWPKS